MEKPKHYQIQYGLTDYDSEKVDVIATEEELKTICSALVRYARKYIYERPIACVAYPDGNASFRRSDGIVFCDCM